MMPPLVLDDGERDDDAERAWRLSARPLPVLRRVERCEGRAAEGDPVALLRGLKCSAPLEQQGSRSSMGDPVG